MRSDHVDYLIATFRTAGMILSARGLLALALLGAFVLAMTAISRGGLLPLIALGVYAAFTFPPLVWLESQRGR